MWYHEKLKTSWSISLECVRAYVCVGGGGGGGGGLQRYQWLTDKSGNDVSICYISHVRMSHIICIWQNLKMMADRGWDSASDNEYVMR